MKKNLTVRLIYICYTYENNFKPRYSDLLAMFADIGRETNLTESKTSLLQSLCTQLVSAKESYKN